MIDTVTKPILFCDFDGTLSQQRYWRSLPPDKFAKLQGLIFGDDKTRVRDWMVGKYTAEEINEYLADGIGMPKDELWRIFVEDCRTMRIVPGALEKLNALRDRYITILTTVNMDSFTRFTVPALKLDEYFDHISNSYYEGRYKIDNSGQLFRDYAKTSGAPIESCVLIDDSLDALETFRKLGGIACPITPEKDILYYLDRL